MSLSFATVDVFTTTKFAGNPLAIVDLPSSSALTQAQKQAIAKEFNLSETVFVHPAFVNPIGGTTWRIDIFTPAAELPFAGHPVIGTACHLLSKFRGGVTTGSFETKAGPIALEYSNATHRASAVIPHDVHVHAAQCSGTELARLQPGLGKYPQGSPVVSIVKGMTFALVDVESLEGLAAVSTTSHKLDVERDEGWTEGFVGSYFFARLPEEGAGVTKLRTRMIDRSVGEDPATGSAASALCSWFAMQNGSTGDNRFEITQGVEMGRKSDIEVQVKLNAERKVEEVRLGGAAVMVMEGKLIV